MTNIFLVLIQSHFEICFLFLSKLEEMTGMCFYSLFLCVVSEIYFKYMKY
jgi:hypothetical protein